MPSIAMIRLFSFSLCSSSLWSKHKIATNSVKMQEDGAAWKRDYSSVGWAESVHSLLTGILVYKSKAYTYYSFLLIKVWRHEPSLANWTL